MGRFSTSRDGGIWTEPHKKRHQTPQKSARTGKRRPSGGIPVFSRINEMMANAASQGASASAAAKDSRFAHRSMGTAFLSYESCRGLKLRT